MIELHLLTSDMDSKNMELIVWIWICIRIRCVVPLDSDGPSDPSFYDTWDTYGGSRYTFVIDVARNVDTTRNNAQRYCRSLGASLVSIQTNEELEWLQVKIKTEVASIGEEFAHQQWWTSGKVDYGVWVWDDPKLTPVTISALHKLTPGKRDHQHFLSITHDNDGWRLRGFPENYKLRFICEKETPRSDLEFRASIEEKLMRYISREYDVSKRDIRRADEVVPVKISYYVKNIIELDEGRQVLSTAAIITMNWSDGGLAWNASDFHNVSQVHYKQGQMWIPDVIVLNSIDDYHLEDSLEDHLWLTSQGRVHWQPEGTIRTLCQVNVRRFPFDHQWCTISLGTHQHYSFNVTFTPMDAGIDVTRANSNHIWYIVGTSVRVLNFGGKCCSTANGSQINFKLHLKRHPAFYVVSLVIPCALLSLLLLVSLWLPYTSGEKLTCIMFVLLAFIVLLNMVCSMTPRSTENVPLLALYVTAMIVIGTLAACNAILVTIIIHREAIQQPLRWRENLLRCLQKSAPPDKTDEITMKAPANYYTNHSKSRQTRVPSRGDYRCVQTRDYDSQAARQVSSNSCDALAVEGHPDLDIVPDYGVIRKEAAVARSLDTLCNDSMTPNHTGIDRAECNSLHTNRPRKDPLKASPKECGSKRQAKIKNLEKAVCVAKDISQQELPTGYSFSRRLDRMVASVLTIVTIVVVITLVCFVS